MRFKENISLQIHSSRRLLSVTRPFCRRLHCLISLVGIVGILHFIFAFVLIKDETKHVGFPSLEASNCSEAFAGRAKNKDFGQTVTRKNDSKIAEDALKDCDSFREDYGFERYPPPSEEEKQFPLAFSIVFHKDFDQVLYLLRAVYQPQNIYCLHVDKKSGPEMHTAVMGVAICLPNVFVASVLEDVVYAGYTRLKADLNCMKDALRHPVKWRYYINMVGQQFPLRTNLELVRILKIYNGKNDIEGLTAKHLTWRYKNMHVAKRDKSTGSVNVKKLAGKTNPPPPQNLSIFKGSAFGTFSREFVDYMMENKTVADLLKWSETVNSPDEYIWSTLHYSKVLKVPGGNFNFKGKPDTIPWLSTYANWGEHPCKGGFVRNICIFSPEELPLLSSRHEFFANKFYITRNPASLHCLDKFIYNLTVSRTVRDFNYYKNLPFITGR